MNAEEATDIDRIQDSWAGTLWLERKRERERVETTRMQRGNTKNKIINVETQEEE